MMSAAGVLQLFWIELRVLPVSPRMTSQGDIPSSLRRAAIRFDVAESDFLVMQGHGIHSLNSLAFKLPKAEDLEVFLQDKLLGSSAYMQEDGEVVTFPRTPALRWADWKMSDDAASIRRLWTFARETARGEIERMSSGDDTRRKVTLVEAVAMETAALSRGCPSPGSDRERPSLFTLNRLGRALQTPGATYDVVPWESYISKEEEDRLMRDGKLPKTQFTELVFREDKVVAKEKSGNETPSGIDLVGSMEVLRARLDIRARAMDMLELAKYSTVRALSDKYYGKLNATVAEGMRCPTINELRRCDRELQVVTYRHLSRGSGSLEEALTYYVNNESDPLWRLLDPVLKNLPDQGVDQASSHQSKGGDKRKAARLEDDDSDRMADKKPKKAIKCLVCGKTHEPLCKLPPDFRKKQRDRKKQKLAKQKADKAKGGHQDTPP